MSKVDMSRYVECPKCHTYQITLNPCQKCLARRMAAEGRLPASGIAPIDPFKLHGWEQRALGIIPKKQREYTEEQYEKMRERMRQIANEGNDVRRKQTFIKKSPILISALRDGEPHYQKDLQHARIMPFGMTVMKWNVTRTMIQMGLIEWCKDGPFHNSPVKIWIPALKIQDAIDYAEELKNGKD